MSVKRRPGTDLNHENWDQEEEPEEQGEFQKASQEEIAKRTIKTAKRRFATPANNDTGIKPTGSMFSSFAGFGKDNGKPNTMAFSFLSSSATTAITNNATNGDSASEKENSNAKSSIKRDTDDDKDQLDYYGKLMGLNKSVAEWVKKKVEENPLCILTPIFDDYAKHLKIIQDAHKSATVTSSPATNANAKAIVSEAAKVATFSFGSSAPSTSIAFPNKGTQETSLFKTELNKGFGASSATPSTFSFGGLTSTAAASSTTAASTFSFGGPGVKPFTFSNVAKPVDSSKPVSDANPKDSEGDNGGGAADDDQPPKYEFVPVVEEDSFYSKRCKVFVKSDKSYADRGVGMLYLKKVESSGKTQLLVRADTSLGNILLNFLLSEGLPSQRMGKKDVMLICLPLPDAQGPTSVLIRVKNEEEAEDLLAEINKNKK